MVQFTIGGKLFVVESALNYRDRAQLYNMAEETSGSNPSQNELVRQYKSPGQVFMSRCFNMLSSLSKFVTGDNGQSQPRGRFIVLTNDDETDENEEVQQVSDMMSSIPNPAIAPKQDIVTSSNLATDQQKNGAVSQKVPRRTDHDLKKADNATEEISRNFDIPAASLDTEKDDGSKNVSAPNLRLGAGDNAEPPKNEDKENNCYT